MTQIKREWDLLSEEERKHSIDEIISYFQTERDETIGIVAAEDILDNFLRITGKALYNKALDDIRPFLEKGLENTLFDIDTNLRKSE